MSQPGPNPVIHVCTWLQLRVFALANNLEHFDRQQTGDEHLPDRGVQGPESVFPILAALRSPKALIRLDDVGLLLC